MEASNQKFGPFGKEGALTDPSPVMQYAAEKIGRELSAAAPAVVGDLMREWKTGGKSADEVCAELFEHFSSAPAIPAPPAEAPAQGDTFDAQWIRFTAVRLRTVLTLLGMSDPFPHSDRTLCGVIGTVLGDVRRTLEQAADALGIKTWQERMQEVYGRDTRGWKPDEYMIAEIKELRTALAAQPKVIPPRPPRPPLSRARIQAIFLTNGFTIKEGQDDLKPYVYTAAYALLAERSAVILRAIAAIGSRMCNDCDGDACCAPDLRKARDELRSLLAGGA